jgi:Flp pilus assembly protein TadD
VRVHEPLAAATTALDEPALAEFAAALEAFRAADWEKAEQRFAALAARIPDDGPTRYYRGLAASYRLEPPPAWTGAVLLTVK